MQETHIQESTQKLWSQQWGSNIIYAANASNIGGVCVLFNPKLQHKVEHVIYSPNGQYVILVTTVSNT